LPTDDSPGSRINPDLIGTHPFYIEICPGNARTGLSFGLAPTRLPETVWLNDFGLNTRRLGGFQARACHLLYRNVLGLLAADVEDRTARRRRAEINAKPSDIACL